MSIDDARAADVARFRAQRRRETGKVVSLDYPDPWEFLDDPALAEQAV